MMSKDRNFEFNYNIETVTLTNAAILWAKVDHKIISEKRDYHVGGNKVLYEMRAELWKKLQSFEDQLGQ